MLETVGLAQDALDVLQHQGWEALLQLRAARKEVQRARLPLPWAPWRKARDEQEQEQEQEQQQGVELEQQEQEQVMEEGQLCKLAEGEEEASSSPGGSHRGVEPSLEAAGLVGGRADGQLAAVQVAAAAMQAQAAGDLEAATGGALVQHLRPQLQVGEGDARLPCALSPDVGDGLRCCLSRPRDGAQNPNKRAGELLTALPCFPLQSAPSLLGRLGRSGASLRRRSAHTQDPLELAFSARGPVAYELGAAGGVELPPPGEEEAAESAA